GEPHDDPAVLAILDLAPTRRAGQGSALAPEAIVLRAVAAMANAGARALRAGFALRPSDIDTVMINAHGFPRWHGGPMKAADLVGLFDILQALKRFSAEDPAIYTPDPGFAALIKEGENFDALNRIGRKRRVIPG
ncbi:MAG: 3-hydroxyacyl-CoA dehydrogenase family protein, partial [Paracoccaceae bacterium]|nr:3-hydroxyacyl-CoA dehydrogenase family protein [Paracoccaceae bacterium]